eukprot:NODE_748_length_630_cov_124.926441_g739_i0.p2 GENE.NODE_748_length_630_cov_124.926441_g739_i0~~NODE_748_length_630_cov_124.926441_g739_i0.p2  ORF type:complete len:87 (-),score=9.49 NODE_748_length_630_cov_124.926441_g739_i0:296-556(-)
MLRRAVRLCCQSKKAVSTSTIDARALLFSRYPQLTEEQLQDFMTVHDMKDANEMIGNPPLAGQFQIYMNEGYFYTELKKRPNLWSQ